LLLADVFEGEVETARGILLHPRRDADSAGLGQSFEPRCDIDAVAKDVAVLDVNIPDIDTDAKLDAVVGRYTGVAPDHLALHLDGTGATLEVRTSPGPKGPQVTEIISVDAGTASQEPPRRPRPRRSDRRIRRATARPSRIWAR
jgi:hypothetical protein